MAITRVADVQVAATGASGTRTTADIDTTSATLIEATVYYTGSNIPTITDSKGCNWHPLPPYTGGSNTAIRKFYAYVNNDRFRSANHNFSVTFVSAFARLSIVAYSGTNITFHSEAGNGGSSLTSLSTGSVTPPENGALITTSLTTVAAISNLAVSGESLAIVHSGSWVAATTMGGAIADEVQTTAAALNPSWSWTTASNAAGATATYYEADDDPTPVQGTPIQRVIGRYRFVTASAVEAHPFCLDVGGSGLATINAPMCVAGAISNLSVQVFTAPGVGNTFKVQATRFVDQGASGGAQYLGTLSATVSGTSTEASDTTNWDFYDAGELATFRMSGTGSPPTNVDAIISFDWAPADGVTMIYGFGDTADPNTAPSWMGAFGSSGWETVANQQDHIASCDGTLTCAMFRVSAAISSGTITFAWEKEAVKQDGTGGTVDTTVVLDSANFQQSSAFSLSVTAGQRLRMGVVESTSQGTRRYHGTAGFVPNTPGQFTLCSLTDDIAASGEFSLATSSEGRIYTATEADVTFTVRGRALTLSDMRMMAINYTPSSTDSVTCTLRKNGADTALSVTVNTASGAGPVLTTGEVRYEIGDTIALSWPTCVNFSGVRRLPVSFIAELDAVVTDEFDALLISP